MSIKEYRSPVYNFKEEELQSMKRIKGMLDFNIIYEKEDDSMSTEKISKRLIEIKERAMITENLNDDRADVNFLLSENQRLVEALEQWYIMFAELGQTGRDSFEKKEDFIEFVKLANLTKSTLQAYKLLEKKD